MSAQSDRFYERQPRYVYRPQDQCFMRFAGMQTRGQISTSKALNISASGLAFCTLHIDELDEGDVIKVEFTPPGRAQIACFATVVRIEEKMQLLPNQTERKVFLVAVQFRYLPQSHQTALQMALANKVGKDEDVIQNSNWLTLEHQQAALQALFPLLLSASLLCWMMYTLIVPSLEQLVLAFRHWISA